MARSQESLRRRADKRAQFLRAYQAGHTLRARELLIANELERIKVEKACGAQINEWVVQVATSAAETAKMATKLAAHHLVEDVDGLGGEVHLFDATRCRRIRRVQLELACLLVRAAAREQGAAQPGVVDVDEADAARAADETLRRLLGRDQRLRWRCRAQGRHALPLGSVRHLGPLAPTLVTPRRRQAPK